MNQEYEIVKQVYQAKEDIRQADELVRQYLPFIKAETAKFLHRPPQEGVDDELCIAMFAFHEAVQGYRRAKGAFLTYAAHGIRNRLIDYYRKEHRHKGHLSLDQREDEEGQTLLQKLDQGHNEIAIREARRATRQEIQEFAKLLESYGLTLADIQENCPKQRRTLRACHRVLAFARENPEALELLVRGKKLPMAMLAEGSGVERKTLERHRRYLVAILLAYTNGFEIIRGHLCQVAPVNGEGNG